MGVSHTQLKAFHSVALTKSFTRAAHSLGMSQPAVSEQVRKMEEQYAVQLFIRSHRNISLTQKGEQLFQLTSKLFSMEADIQEFLQAGDSKKSLTLAVDSPRHLSAFLALFCQLYPTIEVSLITGNSEQNLTRLLSSEADVAVVGRNLETSNQNNPQIDSTILNVAPILLMCGRSHPWSQRANASKAVSIRELQGQTLVMRERGSATRKLVENTLATHNIDVRSVIETTGREAVSDLVADDLGVGFVSAAESYSDIRIVLLQLYDAEIIMYERLVWLKENTNSCTDLFVQLIQDERSTLNSDGWVS